MEADITADVTILVEPVLGKRTALEVHTQFYEEFHNELVGCRPGLAVLFAVDHIIQTLKGRLLLVYFDEFWREENVVVSLSGLLME